MTSFTEKALALVFVVLCTTGGIFISTHLVKAGFTFLGSCS